MGFDAGNVQRGLSLWSRRGVISFLSADNRQCEDDGRPLFRQNGVLPTPLSPPPHTHTSPPPHLWELASISSQEVIGCRDRASTWRATSPSFLFSPSTYLSLFILPLVADGDLALPWRRSPSFPPSASSASSSLPPSVSVRACFLFGFFFCPLAIAVQCTNKKCSVEMGSS